MNMDGNFAKFLDEMIAIKINKIFDQKIKDNNFVMAWVATVVSVGVGVADVKLPGDNINVLVNKKNKTGGTLVIGDEVYLFSPYSNLSTSFIVYKK
jgi:hypothetical protein